MGKNKAYLETWLNSPDSILELEEIKDFSLFFLIY